MIIEQYIHTHIIQAGSCTCRFDHENSIECVFPSKLPFESCTAGEVLGELTIYTKIHMGNFSPLSLMNFVLTFHFVCVLAFFSLLVKYNYFLNCWQLVSILETDNQYSHGWDGRKWGSPTCVLGPRASLLLRILKCFPWNSQNSLFRI